MNQTIKDDLFLAHGLGEPYHKDGRVLIRTNAPYYRQATYRDWVDATGTKTAAGNYFEDQFRKTLLTEGVKGQTFDDKQPVIKRGQVSTSNFGTITRWWSGRGTVPSTNTRGLASVILPSNERST